MRKWHSKLGLITYSFFYYCLHYWKMADKIGCWMSDFSMYKITTIFRRNFINIITHSVTCHQRKKTHRCRWWKFSVMLVDFSSGSQVSSNMAPAKSRLYHSAWNLMRSTRKNILTYHRQNILKLNTLKTIYLWGSVVLSYI